LIKYEIFIFLYFLKADECLLIKRGRSGPEVWGWDHHLADFLWVLIFAEGGRGIPGLSKGYMLVNKVTYFGNLWLDFKGNANCYPDKWTSIYRKTYFLISMGPGTPRFSQPSLRSGEFSGTIAL